MEYVFYTVCIAIQSVGMVAAVVTVRGITHHLYEIEKRIVFDFEDLLRAYKKTLVGDSEKSEERMNISFAKKEGERP